MAQKFDNNLQVSLWDNNSDNPNAPVLKGTVFIEGVKWDISLWNNETDNERAPILKGKLSVPFKKA